MYDFPVITSSRGGGRGTVSGGIMDVIVAPPQLPPMRVGGKRTAVVHCIRANCVAALRCTRRNG